MTRVPAALFCYPWDFVDEGVDALVERCAALGVTHLALAGVYHAGFLLYPHNPRRKVHLLEDGAAYFHPDPACYGPNGIVPRTAALCRETDWFQTIGSAARRAGLQVIAWTVFLHNTPIGLAHPAAAIRNVYGDAYPHALSPAHPDAIAYAQGLVRDLSQREDVSGILLEAVNYRRRAHGSDWVSGHHHEREGVYLRDLEQRLLDLSFNPADVENAQAAGVDVPKLRQAVRMHLDRYFEAAPDVPDGACETIDQFRDAHPELAAYERTLQAAEHRLLERLRAAAGKTLLYGPASPHVDVATIGVYGQSAADAARSVSRARSALPHDRRLMAVIRLGFNSPRMGTPVSSESHLVEMASALVGSGADQLGFYNYAEAPRKSIDWIQPALQRLTIDRRARQT